MANKQLKFVLVKNALPTAKDPYNGQFVSNGTTALEEFAAKVCKDRTNIDPPTLKLILGAAYSLLAETIAEQVVKVKLGSLTFEIAIDGSLPSMDAALGAENPLYIAVRFSNEFIREIGQEVPVRDTDDAVAIKVNDVLDLSTNTAGQINGLNPFKLTGKNITANGEGESLKVIDAEGAEHLATVTDADGKGQRVIAQLTTPPAAGKATILLTSRGYATPDAAPETIRKNVKVLAAPGPKVVNVQDAENARLVVTTDKGTTEVPVEFVG